MLAEARYYARMMAGCYRYVRTPPEPDPHGALRRQIENRESNFLDIVREVVFSNPSNPYHTLFRWAGCSYGDLEASIRRDGLDVSLAALQRAGVYLSHDEFKGKTPIERDGRQLGVAPADLANPLVRGGLETTSSGSRSLGTITRPSVEFQVYREAQDAVVLEQFRVAGRAICAVLPVLPSTVGLNRSLSFVRRGTPIDQWFALGGPLRDTGHYRLLTHLLLLEARALGVRARHPSYLPHNDFSPAASWIAQRRSEGDEVLLMAPVSFGVRVASAAAEAGKDIRGTLFLCGAEPLTDAKREAIERTGAEVFPRYGISEMGWVGCSCPQMHGTNSVHVMRDSVAVISRRRRAPLSDIEVDSLLFTTLLPWSAYIMINVEMEDSGVLEPAGCGCALASMGFNQQLSNIYSYGKLTGHGVTLLGRDMLTILEKILPERFGGAPTDYQLVERDGPGQTITELRVSPRVVKASEDEVREVFMTELKRLWGGSLTHRQWSHADAVRVVFGEPIVSGDRKINPLVLLGSPRPE
jgi:hypothetical protein